MYASKCVHFHVFSTDVQFELTAWNELMVCIDKMCTLCGLKWRRVCIIGPPSFQRFHKGEGNVHSGATPPWLLTDSEEEDKQGDDPGSHGLRRSGVSKGKSRGISVMIGPSEEEFLKHS